MAGQYGLKESKEIIKFAIELGEGIDAALADGKISVADIGLLIQPLIQAGPAFEGIDLVPKELGELDPAEVQELVTFVQDELDLKNDNIEEVIEKALQVGVMIYNFVLLFKKK